MFKIDPTTNLKYFTTPEVRLVAYTRPEQGELDHYMKEYGLVLEDYNLSDPQFLIEFAGRHCYMAFGDNVGSKSNQDYLHNITDHKHYSVLEHLSFTFLFRGISRGFTHEAVRHRHLSPSQFSTRYCKTKDMCFVIPQLEDDITEYLAHCQNCITQYSYHYRSIYNKLKQETPQVSIVKLRKKAKGAARSYLPIGMEAPIILSGNLRSWREFVEKRYSKEAETEINQVALQVYQILTKVVPNGILNMSTTKQLPYFASVKAKVSFDWGNGKHIIGDRMCKECAYGYPIRCHCDGVLHADDTGSDGISFRCDKCGLEELR